jgi:hypothetical protein
MLLNQSARIRYFTPRESITRNDNNNNSNDNNDNACIITTTTTKTATKVNKLTVLISTTSRQHIGSIIWMMASARDAYGADVHSSHQSELKNKNTHGDECLLCTVYVATTTYLLRYYCCVVFF